MKTLNIEYIKEKAEKQDKTEKGHLKGTITRARRILKILERDNFQCVQCGFKYSLTIDHINGRKFAKHDNAQKYKLEKCQTLCKQCHTKKNAL